MMRIFVVLAVSGGIVFWILQGRLFDQEIKIEKDVSSLEAPARSGTASVLLRTSRPELAGEVMDSLSVTPACKAFVSDLQKLDLIALDRDHYQVSYQQLPQKPAECEFADPALLQMIHELGDRCKPAHNQSETINEKCASALFMARASMTRQLYLGKSLSSITDLRVLTDLMFAEFATVNQGGQSQTPPDLRRTKAVAQRMLELKPDLYVAAKVIAFSEVLAKLNIQASKTPMLDEDWSEASTAVARAQKLNPNDDSLKDAEMLIATRGFEPARAIAYADRMITAEPSSAKAHYIKAYAEWKLNHRQAALANLSRAVTLDPENGVYSKTYAQVSRPGAKADAFQGTISFGVGSGDFEK